MVGGYERAGVPVEPVARQQRLNFFPEPHGHGSLRVGRERFCDAATCPVAVRSEAVEDMPFAGGAASAPSRVTRRTS